MDVFIAFVVGVIIGGIICLLGLGLVVLEERQEYADGYAHGYHDGREETLHGNINH